MNPVRFFGLVTLFAFSLLIAPAWLSAQDKKDDPPAQKKDDKKKDDKKEPFRILPKSDTKGKIEELPYHTQMTDAKILRVSGENLDEYQIEVRTVDPAKVKAFKEWQAGQFDKYAKAKTPKEAFDTEMAYLKELPAKQKDIYTDKQYEVKAAEKMKVRIMTPPQEFDDRGFLKEWTPKELAALRGNTKLPGYPSAVENVRVNQAVTVYLIPPKKEKTKKKKTSDDDPPPPPERPQVVLLVILQQK